jgi:hypothetical protein
MFSGPNDTASPGGISAVRFGMLFSAMNSTSSGSSYTVFGSGTDVSYSLQTNVAVYASQATGGVNTEASFVSFNTNGFTLDYTMDTGSNYYFWIAIEGLSSAIGTVTQPSSTGSHSVSGLGFQPKLVFFSSVNTATNSGVQNAANLSIGAANASAQFSTYMGGTYSTSPIDASSSFNRSNVITLMSPDHSTPTLNAQASLTSLNSTGFTLDWTTANATATEVYYVAIG